MRKANSPEERRVRAEEIETELEERKEASDLIVPIYTGFSLRNTKVSFIHGVTSESEKI